MNKEIKEDELRAFFAPKQTNDLAGAGMKIAQSLDIMAKNDHETLKSVQDRLQSLAEKMGQIESTLKKIASKLEVKLD